MKKVKCTVYIVSTAISYMLQTIYSYSDQSYGLYLQQNLQSRNIIQTIKIFITFGIRFILVVRSLVWPLFYEATSMLAVKIKLEQQSSQHLLINLNYQGLLYNIQLIITLLAMVYTILILICCYLVAMSVCLW